MTIAEPPDTMCGGPRFPGWLDRTEDWPAGHPEDAEEEGEVCTQSSFILLHPPPQKVQGSCTPRLTEDKVIVCWLSCSVASCFVYPLTPSLLCVLQAPSYSVCSPTLSASFWFAYPQLREYHSPERMASKLGGLLPPAVDVSATPHPTPNTPTPI